MDGAIGGLSAFHETYGYYAQGVSVSTATLPAGWRDRLVVLESSSTAPGRGLCREPHDCVVSELVAGRGKDRTFAAALLDHGIVDASVLEQRVAMLVDAHPVAVERILGWLRDIGAGRTR